MSGVRRLVNLAESGLVRLLCRVDDVHVTRVPPKGPLILVSNHINFLEIPVLHSRLRPRDLVGLAKAESWKNPVLGWLFDQWGAIPIRRGEGDIAALRRSLDVLRQGRILVVAPEGTRSHDGRLRRGHPGVVTIALKSGAPILPIAFYGGEALKENVRHLRRTPFRIVVGEPLHVVSEEHRPTRETRQAIADEIMYEVAALLPAAYRGVYAGDDRPARRYLRAVWGKGESTLSCR